VKHVICREGELIVVEEEGGYATPAFSLRSKFREVDLFEMFEEVVGKLPADGPTGKQVRITIELL
jgi:hypothetical protein